MLEIPRKELERRRENSLDRIGVLSLPEGDHECHGNCLSFYSEVKEPVHKVYVKGWWGAKILLYGNIYTIGM